MLLIILAVLCLVTSFNSEKVADAYWDHKYKSERDSAANLLRQDLTSSMATIESTDVYEPGGLIDFTIKTPDGPYLVQRYQPYPIEQKYVVHNYPSRSLVVFYERRFPNRCVLSPTMTAARKLVGRPKPARVPDDKISRFVSLWGKVSAAVLFLIGVYSMRSQPY